MRDKAEMYEVFGLLDDGSLSDPQRAVGDFDFSRYMVRINALEPERDSLWTLFVLRVPQAIAVFPPHLYNTPVRRTALEDYLTRSIAKQISRQAHFDTRGIARRRLAVLEPGQKILPRSSVVLGEDALEVRMYVRMVDDEGNFQPRMARDAFFVDLPPVVNDGIIACNLDLEDLNRFVDLMEDVDQVRQILSTRGWIAFVGDGSNPRRELPTDRPAVDGGNELTLDENLREQIDVPNRGEVFGVGIPAGITVILGDEYSGRKELVRGLGHGIYNHIPGDGREWMVTIPDAVYVTAEPGRSVQYVDISAFFASAEGPARSRFSTGCADAYASQAAATVEALEVGARVLILEESESAPSFLSSDSRVRAGGGSTISMAVRARQMVDELGISIVVAGETSVAEFIPEADTVLRVDGYRVRNITAEAKAYSITPLEPAAGGVEFAGLVEKSRWLIPASLDAGKGRFDEVIGANGVGTMRFGRHEVDVSGITQMAEADQTATIARIIQYARVRYLAEGRPIREIMDLVDRDLSTEGLECLARELDGRLARPRRYEIAAALNRIPSLRISHVAE